MKHILTLSLFAIFSLSTYACSCGSERSFCSRINANYFINGGGIVCIAEPTGNVTGSHDFSAIEMKLVDLLARTIQPGSGNYLNSDSTI